MNLSTVIEAMFRVGRADLDVAHNQPSNPQRYNPKSSLDRWSGFGCLLST